MKTLLALKKIPRRVIQIKGKSARTVTQGQKGKGNHIINIKDNIHLYFYVHYYFLHLI